MKDEKKEFTDSPVGFSADKMLSTPFPAMESSENILKDLWAAEKSIADETLNALRARHTREKNNWEKIFAEKQFEVLTLKNKLEDANNKLNLLTRELERERYSQLEYLELSQKDLEKRKITEKTKWDKVSEEIKKFREESISANKKYLDEQNRLRNAKKSFMEQAASLKQDLSNREKELSEINELLRKKEEAWLTWKSHNESEKKLLADEVENLKKIVEDERRVNNEQMEKLNMKLSSAENYGKELVNKLNNEQENKKNLENVISDCRRRIEMLEDQKRKEFLEHEQKEYELKRLISDASQILEKTKNELIQKNEEARKEYELKIERLSKSAEIAEQQLEQQQKINRDIDVMLGQKDYEIQRLLSQREELIREWKSVVFDQQQDFKNRYSEVVDKYLRTKARTKDE